MSISHAAHNDDLCEDIRFVDSIMHFWHVKASLVLVALLLLSGAERAAEWLDLSDLFQVRRVLVQGVALGFLVEFALRLFRAAQAGWRRADTLRDKASRAVDRAKTAVLDRLALYAVLAITMTFAVAAKNMAVGTWLEEPARQLVPIVFLSMLVILGIDAAQSLLGSRDRTDDFLRRLAATWAAIKKRNVDPLLRDRS